MTRTPARALATTPAALLALSLILFFPGSTQAQDALPWFHTYTVPGGYVVGGVDLVPVSFGNSLMTRKISMGGVPANAEVLAAFLYWETVWSGPANALDALRGQVKFRGQAVTAVKSSSLPLTAGCRASGNGQTITMMRADVRRLLPFQMDENGEPTGRLLVNDTDLIANGLDTHTVTLPDSGILNSVPQSAGASLLVVYQDPNPAAPLKSIVVYDGIHVQAPGATTRLTIRGFVDAAPGSAATLTYVGGSGEKNGSEQVYFGGTEASLERIGDGDLFKAGGLLTHRAWSNLTFDIPSGWVPESHPDYGEQVRTSVDHTSPLHYYDCLSTSAIIFSTTTQDADGDGLPDLLESASGLKNPAGMPYPDISGPADAGIRDLFVEIGAMRAPAGSTYGVALAPFVGTITDADGHNHMPTPAVLKKVGDAFANPPVPHLPIAVHFDVGPLDAYRALGPAYESTEADPYIVGVLYPGLARGGEAIEEQPSARFPDFKGVVSWPAGYQFLTLAPVDPLGAELDDPGAAGWCDTSDAEDCRRRFDLNRQGIFHYLLYAHARGVPKSTIPCLVGGLPAPSESEGSCSQGPNPEYYVPKSVAGVAELPGRFALVSLGLWDNFLGTDNMQANTTLHEIGHNLNLWHGGEGPQFTATAAGLRVFVQPNCKPNHLSVMSYLFQATGVRNALGVPQARFSGEVVGSSVGTGSGIDTINEQALVAGPLGLSADAPFTSWYAPKEEGTLGHTLGLEVATKHCDGTPLGAEDPAVGTVRLDTSAPHASIDWAAAGGPLYVDGQDVNFDGIKHGEAALLVGYNDWDGMSLNRLGSGHSMAGFSLGLGLDFGGLDFGGLDYGGLDFGGLDFGGLDFGGLDFGGLDFGGLDFGGLDFGGLDFGGLDFGGLDFGGLESEVEAELTYEIVLESIAPGGSTPPEALKAFVRGTDGAGGTHSSLPPGDNWVPAGEPTDCASLSSAQCHRIRLDWEPPTVGSVDFYSAQRVWDPTGVAETPAAGSIVTGVGSTADAATKTLVDGEELPDGQRFIYWVRGSVGGDLGSLSNFAIVPGRNDAPAAVSDVAVTNEDQSVDIVVVGNDTDVDTALNSDLRVAAGSISNVHGGTAVLLPDGRTVRFTPAANANNVNTPGGFGFSYKANDGTWSRDSSVAMSDDSNEATVTITVNPVNDVPAFTKGANQTAPQNSGPRTVPGWASSITAGPNENEQTVDFIVTNNNNPLFSAQPAIAPNGTLSYTPALNAAGVATVTVRIHDNGGTANGGVNISEPQIFTITVVGTTNLTGVRSADIVMGLKSAPDQGTKFDLKAEVLSNGTVVVASGQVNGVSLGTAGASFDKHRAILSVIKLLAPSLPANLGTLSLRVSVRIAAVGFTHTAGTATLWFNIPATTGSNSRLRATVNGATAQYYLADSFLLKKNDPSVSGPIQSIDVFVDRNVGGNPFKPFGTWSIGAP